MNDDSMSPDHIGTPDFIADPYPAFAKFRDCSPVRYLRMPASRTGLPEDIYSYAILRHADVKAAVRDTDTFSSNASAVIKILPQYPMLQEDPPRHTHLRRLVNKAFYAQKLEALGKVVEQMAIELLETVATGSAVDAVANYTVPMPLRVIGALLGVPREDLPMFRSYADGLISYSMLNPEERKQKIQALMAYITSLVADRRAGPKRRSGRAPRRTGTPGSRARSRSARPTRSFGPRRRARRRGSAGPRVSSEDRRSAARHRT